MNTAATRRYLYTFAGFVVFAAARVLIYGTLLSVFGGFDPVDDTGTFFEMALDPVGQYLGIQSDAEQFPPLFGFVFAPITLFDWFLDSQSLSLRLYLVLIEFVLVAPFFLDEVQSRQFLRASFFLVLPPTILTSAAFAQDEVMSALFFTGILALNRSPWRAFAPSVAAFGFIGVKIFFGPLVAFLLLTQRAPLRAYIAPAFVVAAGYLGRLSYYADMQNFAPTNTFGVSLWSLNLLQGVVALQTMYEASLVLLGLVTLAFLWIWWRWKLSETTALFSLVCYYLIAFAVFYMVCPEYYLVPFSAILILYAMRSISFRTLAWCSCLFAVPFIPNVVNGLKKVAPPDSGLASALPVSQDVALIGAAIVMLLVATYFGRLLWAERLEPAGALKL